MDEAMILAETFPCPDDGSGPDWRHDGACRGMNPDLFFPERGDPTMPAKAVCSQCPVRAECLRDALGQRERFGVWGGLSERERRVLRGRMVRGATIDTVVAETLGLSTAAA
jgi:WhiB family redox-sensing transcriptional regulator